MVEVLLFKPRENEPFFTRFVEKAICILTRSEYCHVGLRLEAGDTNRIAQALPQGFTISDYGPYLDQLIKQKYVDVYKFKTPLNKQQESLIKEYCYKIEGSPYDWFDIFDIAVRIITMRTVRLGRKGKFICSEAVEDACAYAGIDLVPDKESDMVTPEDISESKELVKIKV